MCGIAGGRSCDTFIIENMLKAIQNRGPDHIEVAHILPGNMSLGHVRLSILDLEPRSNQPFWSLCRQYCLVFNGEIYNYQEIKLELQGAGVKFVTESDTEVLLNLLIVKGVESLKTLDGMFSFAFYDLRAKELICARDSIGEKPFYFSYDKACGNFAFCSEIKGLLTLPFVDKSINEESIYDYLKFLYVPAPNTMYKGITELEPGHVLVYKPELHTFKTYPYYSLETEVLNREASETPYEDFKELFDLSVKRRLRSDVPVNVLLSAGLDSNAILSSALSMDLDSSFSAFTMQYSGSKDAEDADESMIASRIAEKNGIPISKMSFDLNQSWHESAERVIDLFSQPFGNSTALVSDQIFQGVSSVSRVALVGDGGDELCVGYPRYKALPMQSKLNSLPGFVKTSINSVGTYLLPRLSSNTLKRRGRKFISGLDLSPSQAFLEWSSYVPLSVLDQEFTRSGGSHFYNKMIDLFERNQDDLFRAASLVDLKSFVPFNLMQSADRTSMAHSVEARCPFLNLDLIHFSLRQNPSVKVEKGVTKPFIVNAMGERLPPEILNLPKKPFNPPIHSFIEKNFNEISAYLTGQQAQLKQYISNEWIKSELSEFSSGLKENSTLIWGLVVLEKWFERQAA